MAIQFTAGEPLTTNLPDTYAPKSIGQVYSVDLNRDGNDDLVVVGASYPFQGTPSPQPAFLALGNGSGGFTAASASIFPLAALATVHPRELVFADFNGDGWLDVFAGDHGYDADPFPGAQNRLVLSNGDGTWRDATAGLPALPDFTHSASAADVDGDGDLDLMVGNVPVPNAHDPYILLNDGTGNFTRASLLPVGSGQLLDRFSLRMASSLLTDLDGDGLAELVVGSGFSTAQNPEPALVVWNHGGSFLAADATSLPLPAFFGAQHSVYDIQPIDVNYDGLKDLLVAYQASVELGGWELQVLVNQGNRAFVDATATYLPESSHGPVPSQASPESQYWVQFLHLDDVNGDGRMDFTVDARGITTAPGTLPIAFVQQADGTFDAIHAGQTPHPNLVDYTTQYVEWTGGSGFTHFSNWDGKVHVNVQPVDFAPVLPVWQGFHEAVTRTGTAGADSLFGGLANDSFTGLGGNDTISGGAGLDAASFTGNRSAYTVTEVQGALTVQGVPDGTDALTGVERLHFDDVSIAFDLDGNAGKVARILGAVFGPGSVGNAEYAGIGLGLMDGGISYGDLMGLALLVRFGPEPSNADFVSAVYENVMGVPPPPGELALFTSVIEAGLFTQASLAVAAADTGFTADRIDLVGLAHAGLEYLPA